MGKWPDCLSNDTEPGYEEEIELIKCPFCGKEEREGAVDCPHYVGYAMDGMEFYWTDDFKILDGIRGAINELYSETVDWEINWDGVFKGIPYWEELNDQDMENSIAEILEIHPFIKQEITVTEVPMMATVHNFIFIDSDRKEEFHSILLEVSRRLNQLLQTVHQQQQKSECLMADEQTGNRNMKESSDNELSTQKENEPGDSQFRKELLERWRKLAEQKGAKLDVSPLEHPVLILNPPPGLVKRLLELEGRQRRKKE